jgi:hypothetical protein
VYVPGANAAAVWQIVADAATTQFGDPVASESVCDNDVVPLKETASVCGPLGAGEAPGGRAGGGVANDSGCDAGTIVGAALADGPLDAVGKRMRNTVDPLGTGPNAFCALPFPLPGRSDDPPCPPLPEHAARPDNARTAKNLARRFVIAAGP